MTLFGIDVSSTNDWTHLSVLTIVSLALFNIAILPIVAALAVRAFDRVFSRTTSREVLLEKSLEVLVEKTKQLEDMQPRVEAMAAELLERRAEVKVLRAQLKRLGSCHDRYRQLRDPTGFERNDKP